MAKKEEPKIVAENELERKIMEAFEVFDHSAKQSVDVREIGTVLRSLGCCPTEEEVQQVITETEHKEVPDTIPLANFLPYMVDALTKHNYVKHHQQAEEVQQVITETEHKEVPDTIPLANFLPYMVDALTKHKFYPANAEQLLEAFRYFDTENRGYLPKEQFVKLMMEEGEPFMQDEVDEMLQTALDPVTDTITYEYYINQLMVRILLNVHGKKLFRTK
ncbi:EF-hand calcium-binding domain-containing protein 2 isoform X1 [Phthorimaea operculella]|nr:EF-hand calcium-binding domain-containing protein 2 isoform X1 [Phthorimaea operculella]